MMKFLFVLSATLVCSTFAANTATCSAVNTDALTGIDFIDMKDGCWKATEGQIETEITASIKYLQMASYFSRDTVNRPGFAKFFFDASNEEREHAYKLIEYLSMRGRYLPIKSTLVSTSEISGFSISKLVADADNLNVLNAGLEDLSVTTSNTTSGLIALKNALKLEVKVTESIRELIKKCENTKVSEEENFNHYHFVDYLTGEFLEEQYKGQREIAGKISTLSKMLKDQGAQLADFLFDKQLL